MSTSRTLKKLPLFKKNVDLSWDDKLCLADIMEGVDSSSGYLRISVVENCNEQCFFCHNEGNNGREKVVDEEVMKKAVRASIDLGRTKFKFTGGEPTLHPSLVDYVAWIRNESADADIGIVTNAIAVSSMAYDLRDAGLDSAVVSLHSLDQMMYGKITQMYELNAALEGVAALDDAGVALTLNMVVSSLNVHEVPVLQAFAAAHAYKFRMLDILPTRPQLEKILVTPGELATRFPNVDLKPKLFHQKCYGCEAKPRCGEGEYLRLSVEGVLIPCLYREDLYLKLEKNDSLPDVKKKIALGFRRIKRDDI
jgi:GTP 3',8-cyclase